jgi:hypothetical protein
MCARFLVTLSLVVSDPCRYTVRPARPLMGPAQPLMRLLALSRVQLVYPRRALEVKSSPEQ